jgi:hypothetical protein
MPHYELSITRACLGDFECGAKQYLVDEDFIGKHQPAARRLLLEYILEAVSQPWAVLVDLKRDGFEDAFCYSFSVWHVPDKLGIMQPGQTGLVYLAFAQFRADLEAVLIFDAELRAEDYWRRGLPKNFKNDFGEPIWTRQPV